MDTARLFQSSHSQAVRLPMEYRFSGNEVVMKYFGNGVLLPINDLPRYQYLHYIINDKPAAILEQFKNYRLG